MPRNITWTRLNATLKAGSNIVQLSQPVDWKANEEIVIVTTAYDPRQSENFTIATVSSDKLTLTLTTNAQYDHLVFSETLSTGETYRIAAAVGLLSRNVKIIGSKKNKKKVDFNLMVF